MPEDNKESFEQYVVRLNARNIEKLKDIGLFPYRKKPAETLVEEALRQLGIAYVPRYYLGQLRGDYRDYRIADFYLPRERAIIVTCGTWESSGEEIEAYSRDRYIYNENSITFIYIYPDDWLNIGSVLKRKLDELQPPPKREEPMRKPRVLRPTGFWHEGRKFMANVFKLGVLGLLLNTIVSSSLIVDFGYEQYYEVYKKISIVFGAMMASTVLFWAVYFIKKAYIAYWPETERYKARLFSK